MTNLLKLAAIAATVTAATAAAATDTVAIKGGIHYEGYLGIVAPGNAYNITLGGTNSGGTAVATTWGGSIYYSGTNSGGSTLNAEPFMLNVLQNGATTGTKVNALVVDAIPLGNNKYFGDDTFNQNGFGATPAPKAANPFSGNAQPVLYVNGPNAFTNPVTGTALTVTQSRALGGLYAYLGTLTDPATLGAAQTYQASDATRARYPAINYKIAATQIAVWDVLGYTVALNKSSNLRPGGANNGVNILDYNGVNLVNEAETYAAAHPEFAGIVVGTGNNPSLIVTTAAVPEPGTWALMVAGSGVVGVFCRKRIAAVAA